MLWCWVHGHCLSLSSTEPLGNQWGEGDRQLTTKPSDSLLFACRLCVQAIALLLFLVCAEYPIAALSASITSFHCLWCGLSYLGIKCYFTGTHSICRTIQGTGCYTAKTGNELLMRNIFFLVNSAEQLVSVNLMSLPSAVAGIIHTSPFNVLAGISSHGRTTESAHL